jgi:chromosome partitioning protein
MLQTIPIINNKGGVGKTTTTVNLACGLARRGRSVLLVDLDSQGSASLALGVDRSDLTPSTAEVLFREVPAAEAVRPTRYDGLDLLTGSLALANADTRLSGADSRETRLRESLAAVEGRYDHILIDCAPSTSLLSINALIAADAFIVPVSPSYLSLEGVVSLGKVVNNVRQGLGEAAPILGVVLTMYRPADDESGALAQELRNHYGGKVFDTEIRYDAALENAPAYKKSIFEHAPESDGAADYASLLDEVESRLERYGAIYGTVRNNRGARVDGDPAAPGGDADPNRSSPSAGSPSAGSPSNGSPSSDSPSADLGPEGLGADAASERPRGRRVQETDSPRPGESSAESSAT